MVKLNKLKYFLVLVLSLIATTAFTTPVSDTSIIRFHLTAITKTPKFRNFYNVDQLNETANYIKAVFAKYADSVVFQEYDVDGETYKNVIASFGTGNTKRIIIGAHYDVRGDQPGADDNASGVVGLLELARLLHQQTLSYRIDLVAYTLEEPPYYATKDMGSYLHAKSLANNNTDVAGMISIEMIGYFKDEKKTQRYPLPFLSLFYGNKGDYITLVKKFGAGKFAKQFTKKYKAGNFIRTKSFTAPALLPGIDYSDHRNYWKFGYSALMITDTSFYRNENYHEPTDTMETLDIARMAKVIDGVFQTLISF